MVGSSELRSPRLSRCFFNSLPGVCSAAVADRETKSIPKRDTSELRCIRQFRACSPFCSAALTSTSAALHEILQMLLASAAVAENVQPLLSQAPTPASLRDGRES